MVPFTLIIVILLINTAISDDRTIEVQLKQGMLQGKVEQTFWNEKEFYSFKGIPYAEPPVGELRFQPPKRHTEWDGILEAFEDKPTCIQFCSKMRNREPFGLSGSEDCLYINVFTPELSGNYPVVVFDYHDNYRTGFNGTKTYSPDFFIEENVIVVMITHRLGLLGYLSTQDDVIPANNGIKDFLLGLQWIKDNIEQFGGDPNKVTLMGNKGAAAMINILLLSKKATGLFSSAIMQSGTALEPIYFFNNLREKAFELGEKLDIKTEDSNVLLEELQKIDVETLILKEFSVIDSIGIEANQLNVYPFSPVVEKEHEDAIITTLPENGKIVNDVPLIIGLTSREGLDLSSHLIGNPRIFQEIMNEISFLFPIRAGFSFDRNSTVFQKDAALDINEFYYKDEYLRIENLLEFTVYNGDMSINYAIDKAARQLSSGLKSPTYYYMFDFRGLLNENLENMARSAIFGVQNWGATTTDELCYLHLCSRLIKTYKQLNKLVTEQPEMKVLKRMVRMWTNFIKSTNPTPVKEDLLKGVIWLPIDRKDQDVNYLHIAKNLKMKKNPLGNRSEFWDAFLEKYSKLAIDGVVSDQNRHLLSKERLAARFKKAEEVEENYPEIDIEEEIRNTYRRDIFPEPVEESITNDVKVPNETNEHVEKVVVVDHDEF